jgi:hypothetical protein
MDISRTQAFESEETDHCALLHWMAERICMLQFFEKLYFQYWTSLGQIKYMSRMRRSFSVERAYEIRDRIKIGRVGWQCMDFLTPLYIKGNITLSNIIV